MKRHQPEHQPLPGVEYQLFAPVAGDELPAFAKEILADAYDGTEVLRDDLSQGKAEGIVLRKGQDNGLPPTYFMEEHGHDVRGRPTFGVYRVNDETARVLLDPEGALRNGLDNLAGLQPDRAAAQPKNLRRTVLRYLAGLGGISWHS